MVADIDLWRAAHQLIKMHGKKAAWQAAMRHNSAREQGDEFNTDMWQRITMMINELQRTDRPKDQALN